MPSSISPPPSLGDSRLLIVSNRLPITIRRSESGKYEFSMSSGGLVTGLSGLSKTTTFQWYGWPGLEVPEDEIPTLKDRLKDEFGATPVFMDDKLADRHYNGFSSKYIHIHPHPFVQPIVPSPFFSSFMHTHMHRYLGLTIPVGFYPSMGVVIALPQATWHPATGPLKHKHID